MKKLAFKSFVVSMCFVFLFLTAFTGIGNANETSSLKMVKPESVVRIDGEDTDSSIPNMHFKNEKGKSYKAEIIEKYREDEKYVFTMALRQRDNSSSKSFSRSSEVNIVYLKGEMFGQSGDVVGAIYWTSYVGTKPRNVYVEAELHEKVSGGKYIHKFPRQEIEYREGVGFQGEPNDTAYWTLEGLAIATGQDGDVAYDADISDDILFNKKAVIYPTVRDALGTSKRLKEPPLGLEVVPSSDRVKWGTTERKKFKKWYEEKYNDGDEYDWSDIEIHHIIPRQYGGTNSTSNLIPLDKNDHRKKVTPWWKNY